ncbi:MAG: amino acid racemase [Oscillospiraceae bacterium]|nr:amino acid racemase [Oscillospiraceae bacterium]
MRKKLGIAGGMGPYASAYFIEQLTRLTRASTDQEHIGFIFYSAPQIPDRSAFLTGLSSVNPLDKLLDVCRILEPLVDVIAIPCMTAHHFHNEFSEALRLPVPDMHRVCAEAAGDCSSLGILATDGTVASGRLLSVLSDFGVRSILPENQAPVMRLIYDVKAGKPRNPELFRSVTGRLIERGAEKILLACTELSVYAGTPDTPSLLDASELYARYCIKMAGGTVVDQCP